MIVNKKLSRVKTLKIASRTLTQLMVTRPPRYRTWAEIKELCQSVAQPYHTIREIRQRLAATLIEEVMVERNDP